MRILLYIGIALLIVGGAFVFVPPYLAQAPTDETPTTWVTVRGNSDIIRNISVRDGDTVSSPLVITGEARGTWYFEASFPVTLTNWDGLIIEQVPAQAQGEWMTEEYVPFEVTLTYENPSLEAEFSKRGSLIFQKDNPSGLLEHDDAYEITVFFE